MLSYFNRAMAFTRIARYHEVGCALSICISF